MNSSKLLDPEAHELIRGHWARLCKVYSWKNRGPKGCYRRKRTTYPWKVLLLLQGGRDVGYFTQHEHPHSNRTDRTQQTEPNQPETTKNRAPRHRELRRPSILGFRSATLISLFQEFTWPSSGAGITGKKGPSKRKEACPHTTFFHVNVCPSVWAFLFDLVFLIVYIFIVFPYLY